MRFTEGAKKSMLPGETQQSDDSKRRYGRVSRRWHPLITPAFFPTITISKANNFGKSLRVLRLRAGE
jgi:hypothetical protein